MIQTLVVLAAGLSSRFGSNKQLAPVGPNEEVLLDYAVHDAKRAGFDHVTFVIRPELARDFQNHVNERFGRQLSVSFAFQDAADLPTGFAVPKNRKKPWGTAHAILAVRDIVLNPFVVINADDFYGAAAYSLLYNHLEDKGTSHTPDYAMIGYTLSDTFSEFGGVSRGICDLTEHGYLQNLVEVKKIESTGDRIGGVTVDGEPVPLNGNETVSMNIWGLTPAVFPILEQQFTQFLTEHAADPDAEFLISSALNEQIAAGDARLKVLPTRDQWIGMTFQKDSMLVKRQLANLVERGEYPKNLTAWFLEQK
jgi:UTP-glucose-1-phosphate uridylyltransferase